jgi:hypothetical protein
MGEEVKPTLFTEGSTKNCLLLFFLVCPWFDLSFLRKRWMLPIHIFGLVVHILGL